MEFWTIFWAVYTFSTIFAIAMTYREQKRSGRSTPLFVLIGYLLCTVWPVVVAVVLIFYRPVENPDAYSSDWP